MQLPDTSPYARSYARQRARRRSRVMLAVLAILAVGAVAAAAIAFATSNARTPLAAAPVAETTRTAEASTATEPSVEATPVVEAPSAPATITVAAVGDMIFDRRVKTLVASQGGAAPLAHLASLLKKPDITVGNLESSLSNGGTKNAEKDVTFRGDPRGVKSLTASGFDFLSLANNHVLDYGPAALADTVEVLDDAGIGHAGAGADRTAAWKPAVRDIDGTTVAFLSFSHILPAGFVATDSKAGLAAGRGNMDAVAKAIREAKAEYDYVLVSFHWGVEYKDYANGDQVRDAHTAIDAGADMVLSHHPHVIQGVEFYNGKLIAYSLGDFVFDHYSRKTGEAFVLDASLGPKGVSDVTVTPVYLDTDGAPSIVTGDAATTILKRLKTISVQHGAKVDIEGDTARVLP